VSDGDATRVHVHLTIENLAGCFFNFGYVEAGSFPFTAKVENSVKAECAANAKNIAKVEDT
jgi:hypothetical protein